MKGTEKDGIVFIILAVALVIAIVLV